MPLALKPAARATLVASAQSVSKLGGAALVRINGDVSLAAEDLQHAIDPAIRALLLPKVESGEAIRALDLRIGELELHRGMRLGHTLFIAQIEHVRTLPYMDEIATSSKRLMGMILGPEDFSVSADMQPTPETLYGPNQQLLFACRRAGILPFGFPGSISVFGDIQAFRLVIGRAREMGFVGSYAVHPDQVKVMNELFVPSKEDGVQARELIAASQSATQQGRGAFEYRGRMVDPPVLARAEATLRRQASFIPESVKPK